MSIHEPPGNRQTQARSLRATPFRLHLVERLEQVRQSFPWNGGTVIRHLHLHFSGHHPSRDLDFRLLGAVLDRAVYQVSEHLVYLHIVQRRRWQVFLKLYHHVMPSISPMIALIRVTDAAAAA